MPKKLADNLAATAKDSQYLVVAGATALPREQVTTTMADGDVMDALKQQGFSRIYVDGNKADRDIYRKLGDGKMSPSEFVETMEKRGRPRVSESKEDYRNYLQAQADLGSTAAKHGMKLDIVGFNNKKDIEGVRAYKNEKAVFVGQLDSVWAKNDLNEQLGAGKTAVVAVYSGLANKFNTAVDHKFDTRPNDMHGPSAEYFTKDQSFNMLRQSEQKVGLSPPLPSVEVCSGGFYACEMVDLSQLSPAVETGKPANPSLKRSAQEPN